MRIVELRLHPYRLPLTRPLRAAWGTLHHREGWVVLLRDETGGWGLGEAAPLPGYGMEAPEACRGALERAEAALPGLELADLPPPATAPDGLAALDRALAPVLADAEGRPAARHALEQALLDRLAARAGAPLAAWLVAGAIESVPANATLGADPAPALVGAARARVAEGYDTLKVKVAAAPGGVAEDVARIRALREAVGPAIALRLDANGGWDAPSARDALAALASLEIEYVEQPLPREDVSGMARLAAESPIPLAADESAESPAAARAVIAAGAARVLVLKPMTLGGLLPTLQIAAEALAAGLRVVVTTSLEGAVGRLGALHVAAALGGLGAGPLPACGLATAGWLAEDLLSGAPPDGPRIAVPQRPGLGWLAGEDGRPRLLR